MIGLLRAARGVARVTAAVPDESARSALTYLAVYACGFGGRGSLARFEPLRAIRRDPTFLARLQHLVPDSVAISDWTATGSAGERVRLIRRGIRAFIGRARLGGAPVTRGRRIRFEVPALVAAAGGFVRRRPAVEPTGPLSRFYLNVSAESAPWVLGPLARLLERNGPVAVKVLADPRAYLRRDAAVVYVPTELAGRVYRAIVRSAARSGTLLRPGTPVLTLPLAPGIGFADEPSDLGLPDLSHGRWVSDLLLRAAAVARRPRAIAAAAMELAAESGRNPEQPWLRAGRRAADLDFAAAPSRGIGA